MAYDILFPIGSLLKKVMSWTPQMKKVLRVYVKAINVNHDQHGNERKCIQW